MSVSVRLHRTSQHLSRGSSGSSGSRSTPQLTGVTIGDTAQQWAGAGFCVSASGEVRLGNFIVRLRGDRKPVFELCFDDKLTPAAAAALCERLPAGASASAGAGVSLSGEAVSARAATAAHPNGVMSLAELVIVTPGLTAFVSALAGAGVCTVGDRPPKQMKGDPTGPTLGVARYFLQPQLRVLVVGAEQPATAGLMRSAASKAPAAARWMFGSYAQHAAGAASTIDRCRSDPLAAATSNACLLARPATLACAVFCCVTVWLMCGGSGSGDSSGSGGSEVTGWMVVTRSMDQVRQTMPPTALPPARQAMQPGRQIVTLHAATESAPTAGPGLGGTMAFLSAGSNNSESVW
jgi:hypothetical protein